MQISSLIILFVVLPKITSYFCSAYCGAGQCSGTTENDCTGCDSPFVLNGSSCAVGSNSGYSMQAEEDDLAISPNFISSCGGYNYYGEYLRALHPDITYGGPISAPHFQIRLIVWVILWDDWNTALDYFRVELTNTGAFADIPLTNIISSQNLYCESSFQEESYMKLDVIFFHSSTTEMTFIFDISTPNYNLQYWGVKQFMLLTHQCHSYCTSCFQDTNADCDGCEAAYFLSDTTCDTDCLTGYGVQSGSNVCIQCDFYCSKCAEVNTNCSSCTTSGVYEAFLFSDSSSCLTTCPSGYAEVISTHTCEQCQQDECLECDGDDLDVCWECDANVYWMDYECFDSCPDGYFEDGANCTQCHSNCTKCDGDPSPCSECTPGMYLHNSECGDCPEGYFGYQLTWQCRDCSIYCVNVDIQMHVDQQLTAYITFSQPVDFQNIDYQNFQTITISANQPSLHRFTITTQIVNSTTYKIVVVPVGTIQMQDVPFMVEINNFTTVYYSEEGNRFSDSIYSTNASITWTLTKLPSMSVEEQTIIDGLQHISDNINNVLCGQLVQGIKKSGVFAFFLPGAQLSSSLLLHSGKPPENGYELMRLFGSFVFFDVPRWQEDSSHTKYMFDVPVPTLIQASRLLPTYDDTQQEDWWRFSRTGHSTYFLLDAYLQLGLLVLCWVLAAVTKLCFRSCPRFRSNMFILLHYVHQIMLFYIALSAVLEWLVFSEQTSAYRTSSLIISVVSLVYFLCYELLVFYRLLPYCWVELKSAKFQYYVEYYSYFLRDLRYEKYASTAWSFRHIFRPYNYRLFSFFRVLLIVSALPLFHSFPHGPVISLIIIQALQLIRFLLTWPYSALWRNIYTLFMQILLLVLFVLYLLTDLYIPYLYTNLNTIDPETISQYYRIGWAIGGCAIVYNISFFLYLCVGVVIGCRWSNRQRMEWARKQYYQELFEQLDSMADSFCNKSGEVELQAQNSIYVRILNQIQESSGCPSPTNKQEARSKLILQGNLIQQDYDRFMIIFPTIEQYKIVSSHHSRPVYSIHMQKVSKLFMCLHPSPKQKDNLISQKLKNKQFKLHSKSQFAYYSTLEGLFGKYATYDTQDITIQTQLKVDQNCYEAGQEIIMHRHNMRQYVFVKKYNEGVQRYTMQNLLPGFPINPAILELV